MQLEVGNIIEGKITGITRFGAFVELSPELTGLVHISEISNDYVKEIADYVKEGEIVKVKVLNIDGNKVSLSIRQTLPKPTDTQRSSSHSRKRHSGRPSPYRGAPKKEEPTSFEDMLARFKQNSEEKMSDIKRNMEGKRGSYSRRR